MLVHAVLPWIKEQMPIGVCALAPACCPWLELALGVRGACGGGGEDANAPVRVGECVVVCISTCSSPGQRGFTWQA